MGLIQNLFENIRKSSEENDPLAKKRAMDYMIINGFILSVLLLVPFLIQFTFSYAFSFPWLFYIFLFIGLAIFKVFLKPSTTTKSGVWHNWDSSQTCVPSKIHYPQSEDEIVKIVENCYKNNIPIKVTGSSYSFSPICVTNVHNGEMMNLEKFNKVTSIDADNNTFTCQAGAVVKDLNEFLWYRGLHLSIMGGVTGQTITGAISTGTHGSSVHHGNIASYIISFNMVTGEGKLITASENENRDIFEAGRVGIGALGIITQVTMQCEPAYYLQRKTEGGITVSKMWVNLENTYFKHDYHSFWWDPTKNQFIAFTFDKVTKPTQSASSNSASKPFEIILAIVMDYLCYVGSSFKSFNLFIMSLLYEAMKSQKIVIDRGYRVMSFSGEMLEYASKFAEAEFFVPREKGEDVLNAIKDLIKRKGYSFNFPISLRFVKKDNQWLSQNYETDTIVIDFAMIYKEKEFRRFYTDVAEIMRGYKGRPHWGKNHSMKEADFKNLYPKLQDFKDLRSKLDPKGIFLNSYLKECLFENNVLRESDR